LGKGELFLCVFLEKTKLILSSILFKWKNKTVKQIELKMKKVLNFSYKPPFILNKYKDGVLERGNLF